MRVSMVMSSDLVVGDARLAGNITQIRTMLAAVDDGDLEQAGPR